MTTVNVIPVNNSIWDPDRRDFLPEGGRTVPFTEYWVRRIRDGDVTTDGEAPPPPPPPPPSGGGVPSGGTTGQIMVKASGTDYDVNWVDQTGSGTGTDLSLTNHTSTTLTLASNTGADVALPLATTLLVGLMSAAALTKLNNIEANATTDMSAAEIVAAINSNLGSTTWQGGGGGGGGAANLAVGTVTSTVVPITNDNGTGFTIPAATTSLAGVMSAAALTKLNNIEANATTDMSAAEIVTAINSNLGSTTWQGGGGGGTVDETIINGSANAVAGNAVFDALALKANKSGDTLTGATLAGPTTVTGVGVVIPTAMGGSTEMDVTKPLLVKVVAGNIALTFSGVPTVGTSFVWHGSNSSGATRVVSLPSDPICYSVHRQAVITSFDLPNNGFAEIKFDWDGVKWKLQGDPVPLSTKAINVTFDDGADDTVTLVLHAPHAGTIFRSISQCASGTATYTVKINNTAVTATANAVTTAKDERVVSAPNTFAIGDKISVTRSANSSCINGALTLLYAPTAP